MRWRYRMLAWVLPAGLLVGGCLPSEPTEPETMDRLWVLSVPPTWEAPSEARTEQAGEDGGALEELPRRWTIHQEPSLVWSTVSIVRATDAIRAGGIDQISFSVSPAHTDQLADTLVEARRTVERLEDVAEAAGRGDTGRWADGLAWALVNAEDVIRSAQQDPVGRAGAEESALMASPAGPILQMLSSYLNRTANDTLLGDLHSNEVTAMREAVAQVVLRAGFQFAGKQDTPELRGRVIDLMQSDAPEHQRRERLADLLVAAYASAPAVGADASLAGTIESVLQWAPLALRVAEQFVRQWDRMESITVEIAPPEAAAPARVTFRVQPGEEVRLEDLVIMQPTLAFRGETAIVAMPDADATGETVVLFEPADKGAVELRFTGLGYGVVRLVALPLANGALRQVRVASGRTPTGERTTHVSMAMLTDTGSGDPRRLIVVQDVRRIRRERTLLEIRERTLQSRTWFHYLTPDRHYTYLRAKDETPG